MPTWGTFVLLNAMGLVDMFWVGKLGADAVAAVTMGGIMIGIVVMLALGVEVGTTALVANAVGRDQRRHAGKVAAQGLLIALAMAGALAAVAVPLAPFILQGLGAAPEVVRRGTPYLRIVAGGGVTIMLQISLGAALRGAGDASTPFKAMGLANIANITSDPIFIFGLLGMPALGVAGSGWVTVLSRVLGVGLMLKVLFTRGRSAVDIRMRDMKPRFDIMQRIVRIGIFASGRAMLRNVGRLAMLRMAAVFGMGAVAAFGICFRLQLLVLGPGKGFGAAAATMVGQNLGARQPGRAEMSGWIAAGIGLFLGFLFTAGFWAAPGGIIRVFNSDPEVVRAGVPLVRWFSASFPLLVVGLVLGEAMNGAGDSLRPMLITGLAQVVLALPLAGLLAASWGSAEGIWTGLFAGNSLMGVLAAGAFYVAWWKDIGEPGSGVFASAGEMGE